MELLEYGVSLTDSMSGPASQAATSLSQLGTKLFDTSSAVKGLDAVLPGASEALGALAIAGAAAGAVLGLAAAAIKTSIEMSELREKTLITFSALAGGKEAGAQTLAMIDALREKTGLTRAELVPMTNQLLAMGIAGDNLKDQLTALATVRAIGIDGGEQEYINILKKLQAGAKVSERELANLSKTGVNVNEVAKAMGLSTKALEEGLRKGTVDSKAFGAALQKAVTTKGVDALAHQANTLSAQWSQFKENFALQFESEAVSSAAQAAFGSIFKWAKQVLPYIKRGFLEFMIVAVKAYILAKQHWSQITFVLKGVGIAVAAAAIGFGVFVGVIIAAVTVIGAFVGAIGAAVGWLVSLGGEAMKAGISFISGFVDGIKSGINRVVDAAKSVGDAAKNAVTSALGIKSPSTVMMRLGGHTASGFAGGIKGGAGQVSGAASGMAGAAVAGSSPKVSDYKGAGGQGGGVNVDGGIHISIQAPGGVTDATSLTETAIAALFERLALQQGLA